MHVFLSGIGGAGIGPLARIALELGYSVSGSDMTESPYLDELRVLGINILPGQDGTQIKAIHKQKPIDWFIYASAVVMKDPNGPEISFAKKEAIKSSKRDEFLNHILNAAGLKLLAVAGTHGKTTTTAMCIWLMTQLGLPLSWSVGGKISFGQMGHADKYAEWFVYECDEFDRNFLSFNPELSLISGLAYDHHEIFPSQEDYNQAFRDFIKKSNETIILDEDISKLYSSDQQGVSIAKINDKITLAGAVNRLDASLAIAAVQKVTNVETERLVDIMNKFPGVSRRFEILVNGLVTDYAHTPEKIRGCLELAKEKSTNIVVLHEPLTNRRQHFIKEEYKNLFKGVKKLYWLPAFQAREHPGYKDYSPTELIEYMDNSNIAEPAKLNEELVKNIRNHITDGDLVIGLSGGGANSLDSFLRQNF